MFGHNSFDSPQPLVFETSSQITATTTSHTTPRKIHGDTPEFFEFCGVSTDVRTVGWMSSPKGKQSFTSNLGSYWIPKGWSVDLYDENGNFAYTDIAIKEGKAVCVPSNRIIKSAKAEYVGFCEDSNRKSLREGLVGDVIIDGKSNRDKENVCGDCVDGYEENADGKCVEKQDDSEDETKDETKLKPEVKGMLILGGTVLAVVIIGPMIM